ncbi:MULTISPECIES: DUF4351 domain-containing protein [Nostocales]|uniref:DUF4351 domain-containing protein n=4 Tax=Nostocales TaxID=1161 RepID=A0A0C1NBX0_9CYAN|nr:DUF4351 domain-containing protein [Tolypothrix bouteillei]
MKDLIHQFLPEDMMRESVIYQDIAAKERKQEAILLIMRQLNRRFSQLDSLLVEQVQGLSIKQLEDLAEAFVDFSEVGDLVIWLNQQHRE